MMLDSTENKEQRVATREYPFYARMKRRILLPSQVLM